jgi:hypothetical protein
MVQRASQQYLECRRGVTAKVDEVKQLDEQIGAVFAQISALSEAPEGQEELSEQAKAAAKSVGRLEVTLAGVEGEEPVAGAAITVALDPEYEADEYETVEEVVEKKDVVVTDENGNVVEEGQLPEEDGESTPRKLKTTTKITRTIIKKKVKKEKKPVVRTVAWTAKAEEEGEEQEQGEKPLSFPATFVFDPVQSREAVVIVTVAAAETEDEEEPEPIREIEFPISSLFQDNALDKWYTTAEEEEEQEPTTITELVEEAVQEAIEVAEAVEEAIEEAVEEAVEEEVAAEKAEKTEEEAEKTEEEAEKTEETETAEEETAKAEEVEKTEEKSEEEAAEVVEKPETEAETAEVAAEQVEEPQPTGPRFHVKASFVLSEAEKLSISVVALSKKKQEAEAALQMLEREAASLRTKFERLNASQRQLSASSVSKPKSNLLGGRFGAGGAPVPRKTWIQSSRERANAFITKNQQLLISVGMFTCSVCVFHYNGENLLA